MIIAPTITSTGIIAPTYAEILDWLKASYRSIFGSDIYLEPDSQDGQFLAILASAIHDVNDSIIAAYNSFSPLTAQGVGLSTVVKINGIRRLVPSNSQVVVSIGGTVGTTINFGQVADAQNNRWTLPATVIIPDAGTIDVTATAVNAGALIASPGTVNKIVTPVRGWQTVTNAAAADPGMPVESDATLRMRQSQSTAIPALSVLGAILGAIKNIVGVGRATIYENDTGTTDGDGVPGHSISAVVEGGDITTIAQTIQRYKTPGTGTYGTTAVTVRDILGIASTIRFYQLTLIDMAVYVPVTAETGYISTTAGLIEGALAAWYNALGIGQDSQLNKLWSPVNLTGDAATESSGQSQAQLDVLSNTYNATAIYQARKDNMILTALTAAGSPTFHVANAANYAIGKGVAIVLDNGAIFVTTITNVAALVITTAANVPALRNAPIGALMYVAGDIVAAFNEAVQGAVIDMDVVAS